MPNLFRHLKVGKDADIRQHDEVIIIQRSALYLQDFFYRETSFHSPGFIPSIFQPAILLLTNRNVGKPTAAVIFRT